MLDKLVEHDKMSFSYTRNPHAFIIYIYFLTISYARNYKKIGEGGREIGTE